jgi:Tfp pilus assembly protein PilN
MTTPEVRAEVSKLALTPSLPRVNLMPPEIAAAAKFRRFQFGMAGAVAAAVAVVAALYVQAHSGIASAQSALTASQARHDRLQQQLSGLSSVPQVYAQAAAKQAMLQQAMGGEIRWSFLLNDLALNVPANVWLTNVQATESGVGTGTAPAAPGATNPLAPAGIGTLSFQGVAFSHDDVATWLDMLAKEKGLINPYFSNSTEAQIGPRTVVNFTSTATLTAAAKSNRYTTASGS